ncbi:hypothetical protein EDD86DRAFT_56920 [Gorgonomyces haynaldii]|nr:hypothetical protein EDD86DRAFT_56920 [Gorgonomyces haynaldii]
MEVRLSMLKYLQRVFTSQGPYLGSVLIPLESLYILYPPTETHTKSEQLFLLGLSLGKLARTDEEELAKTMDTLLHEFEADQRGKRNRMFSRSSDTSAMSFLEARLMENQKISVDLDYIRVFYHLCSVLIMTYKKLLAAKRTDAMQDYLTRIDQKVHRLIVHPAMQDLDVTAKGLLREQWKTLVTF